MKRLFRIYRIWYYGKLYLAKRVKLKIWENAIRYALSVIKAPQPFKIDKEMYQPLNAYVLQVMLNDCQELKDKKVFYEKDWGGIVTVKSETGRPITLTKESHGTH